MFLTILIFLAALVFVFGGAAIVVKAEKKIYRILGILLMIIGASLSFWAGYRS